MAAETDIPRLTDEELDALLDAHFLVVVSYPDEQELCKQCRREWPCETVRLATEVKDLRAVRDAAKEWRRMNTGLHTAGSQTMALKKAAQDGLLRALARYEEGGR